MKIKKYSRVILLLVGLLSACSESEEMSVSSDSGSSGSGVTLVSIEAGDHAQDFRFELNCLNLEPMFQFTVNDSEANLRLAVVKTAADRFNLNMGIADSTWVMDARATGASFSVEGNKVSVRGEASVIVAGKKERTEQVSVNIVCR